MELNTFLQENESSNFIIVKGENDERILKEKTHITINDSYEDIKDYDFIDSKIKECQINGYSNTTYKYRNVLLQIYNEIGCGARIIKKTKLNIKTIKFEEQGYNYINNLGISFQNVNSSKCLLEIINQCIENNIKLNLSVKLKDQITMINIII